MTNYRDRLPGAVWNPDRPSQLAPVLWKAELFKLSHFALESPTWQRDYPSLLVGASSPAAFPQPYALNGWASQRLHPVS